VKPAVPRWSAGLRVATVLAAIAGCAGPVGAAEGLSGEYTGLFDGRPAMLVLHDFGASLTGRLSVEDGYAILLNGSVTGGVAAGGASSPTGVATFEVRPNASGVTLTLEEAAPVSGKTVRTRFEFSRFAQAPAAPDAAADTDSMQRDLRLVGTWRTTRTHRAGDMVLRLNFVVELRADGSFHETADAGAGGSTSLDRKGQWSTGAGALRIRAGASGDWASLGRYQVRSQELVLIGADGASEVWRRP
jgi:hypothetical protein